MTFEMLINVYGTERLVQETELPIEIGTAASSDIRSPGQSGERKYAQIGVLDGRLFVQPLSGLEAIVVNGDSVSTSRWLVSGDQISIPGLRIEVEISDHHFRLNVFHEFGETDVAPADSGAIEQGERIAPQARGRQPAVGESRNWKKISRVRVAIGSVIAALGLILFQLFTSTAVSIRVEPDDARIAVTGGWLTPKIGGRYLLRDGSYRVMATAEGYSSLREEIEIGGTSNPEFSFAMSKLPGRVMVSTTQNAIAEVVIDEQPVGVTPTGEIELAAGPHELELRAPRYQPYSQELEVQGQSILETVLVELVPNWANVTIVTEPDAAEIFIGEESVARSPATIEVIAGEQEITIRKDGYKDWRKNAIFVANEPIDWEAIVLEEADGVLRVTTRPTGVAVTVNDRYLGAAPVTANLAVGNRYQVIASKSGYRTAKQSITMNSSGDRNLHIELQPLLGKVRVNSEPTGAALYVNGKKRGVTPADLELLATGQRIELRHEGYAPFSENVTPKPGLPQTIEAVLLTPEEAKLAKNKQTISTSQGLSLRLVGPGAFEMGSPRREQGRRPNESPRAVRLTRPFYFAAREITNREFMEFDDSHASGGAKYRELARPDHPVVMLSWEKAAEFCNWLSEKDGLPKAYREAGDSYVLDTPVTTGYRLPTEAEWVWVARFAAGTKEKLKYSWGDGLPPPVGAGNFADQSAKVILPVVLNRYNDGYPITAPVGSFAAFPLGIHDLGGNAAEWLNDYYEIKLAADGGVEADPIGPPGGQYRVIRGSSWRHASISELRTAYRDFGDQGRLDVGFRLARYIDSVSE